MWIVYPHSPSSETWVYSQLWPKKYGQKRGVPSRWELEESAQDSPRFFPLAVVIIEAWIKRESLSLRVPEWLWQAEPPPNPQWKCHMGKSTFLLRFRSCCSMTCLSWLIWEGSMVLQGSSSRSGGWLSQQKKKMNIERNCEKLVG